MPSPFFNYLIHKALEGIARRKNAWLRVRILPWRRITLRMINQKLSLSWYVGRYLTNALHLPEHKIRNALLFW